MPSVAPSRTAIGALRARPSTDLNLFVEGEDLRQAIAALCLGGAEIDEASALASSQTRGDFRGRVSGMRLDVFTPSIEFSDEAERTRFRTELLGEPVWILSAEATAVFKLLFFRPKDVLDLERDTRRAHLGSSAYDTFGPQDTGPGAESSTARRCSPAAHRRPASAR